MIEKFPSESSYILDQNQTNCARGGSIAGNWGGGLNCLFHIKGLLTLLFAIGNIAVWGAMAPRLPWIRP